MVRKLGPFTGKKKNVDLINCTVHLMNFLIK